MKRRILVAVVLGVMSLPATARAQSDATGSIAGVARDTTTAVLPGVTVEAASAALIEKVRTVVTDTQGQYKIVDLRPGTYTVTFTAPATPPDPPQTTYLPALILQGKTRVPGKQGKEFVY